MNRSTRNREEIWIRISVQKDEPLAKLFRAIKEHPNGKNEVFISTMAARLFAPALDKYGGADPKEIAELALQGATQLEGYAQALRQKYQLPSAREVAVFPSGTADTSSSEDEAEAKATKIVGMEEREQQRQIEQKLSNRKMLFGNK